MLTIIGRRQRLCDQGSRRDFLKIGGLALGGLSLPQILRAEADAGISRSHKAVIMIFLSGGPPHQDMVDLKPNAPAEIRGEFRPIRTNVAGQARERPVHFQEVYATLYRNLGIDVNHATVTDHGGRPHYLVDGNAQAIRELM